MGRNPAAAADTACAPLRATSPVAAALRSNRPRANPVAPHAGIRSRTQSGPTNVLREAQPEIAFFEGKTVAPRTGIIDAIAFRLGKKDCDLLEVRLKWEKSHLPGERERARLHPE